MFIGRTYIVSHRNATSRAKTARGDLAKRSKSSGVARGVPVKKLRDTIRMFARRKWIVKSRNVRSSAQRAKENRIKEIKDWIRPSSDPEYTRRTSWTLARSERLIRRSACLLQRATGVVPVIARSPPSSSALRLGYTYRELSSLPLISALPLPPYFCSDFYIEIRAFNFDACAPRSRERASTSDGDYDVCTCNWIFPMGRAVISLPCGYRCRSFCSSRLRNA